MGFCAFHEMAGKIDFEKDYEPQAVKGFSGALAVDEVYDGELCLFFATDPLNNRTVSFHLCRSGSSTEALKFLRHLESIGIVPKVLIVDGSNIYRFVARWVWPDVEIQQFSPMELRVEFQKRLDRETGRFSVLCR
jgi:transposase-like protein